jgi:hypothetical protein
LKGHALGVERAIIPKAWEDAMKLFVIAAIAVGLAGCVSLPSLPKDNLTGVMPSAGLPKITHRSSFRQGMDGESASRSLENID